MHNKLFALAEFLILNRKDRRSYFYRHKEILKLKCKDFSICEWAETSKEIKLVQLLARYAPLKMEDLEGESAKILNRWKHLPKDSKFFEMLLNQMKLWKAFENEDVASFLKSTEGYDWISARKKMQRDATFELDRPFKSTKTSALENQEFIRKIIRSHPLVTFSDLKQLGAKNLQPIWENFPQRAAHRNRALQAIESELGVESSK